MYHELAILVQLLTISLKDSVIYSTYQLGLNLDGKALIVFSPTYRYCKDLNVILLTVDFFALYLILNWISRLNFDIKCCHEYNFQHRKVLFFQIEVTTTF